jgi:DNA-binding GntR family transcriptional regulator
LAQIVPKSSAVLVTVNAEPIAINKDHVNINKFASANDEDFKTISSHLRVMVKAATERADANWRRYRRDEGE